MKQKRQHTKKDILFILISSFIVVVAWIAFSIYHILVTSTVSQQIQTQLTPINPQFDPTTIQQLKTRVNIIPQFNLQSQPSTSQSAQAKPTPQSTSLAIPASESSRFAPANTHFDIKGQ